MKTLKELRKELRVSFARGGEFLFGDNYNDKDLDKFEKYVEKKYGKINVKVGKSYKMTWGSDIFGDGIGMLLVHDPSLWNDMKKDKKLMTLIKKLN